MYDFCLARMGLLDWRYCCGVTLMTCWKLRLKLEMEAMPTACAMEVMGSLVVLSRMHAWRMRI